MSFSFNISIHNSFFFFLLNTFLCSGSLHGQWIHDWAAINVDGGQAFQLIDSTSVHAQRTNNGFTIFKRVLVNKSSIQNNSLQKGSILLDSKGIQIGKTLEDLIFIDLFTPTTRRLAKKYVSILIKGDVNSSSFIRNSWPDKALVRLMKQKRVGAFWPTFKEYLKKFNFVDYKKSDVPEEISDAGLNVYFLPYRDYLNKENQGFRMIIFTRGTSAIQCVLVSNTDSKKENLDFPKIKLFEEKPYGSLYHFGKPNKNQSEGYEVMAYDLMPFED